MASSEVSLWPVISTSSMPKPTTTSERIAEPADLAADDEAVEDGGEQEADRGELADRAASRWRSMRLGGAAQAPRHAGRRAGACTAAERMVEGGDQRRRSLPCFPHRRHDASSTIQATSSGKLCPAWAASSGTSEVRVMPGCVFTSSQIDLAGPVLVEAEVGAGDAAAADGTMRFKRKPVNILVNKGFKRRRAEVF